MLIANRPSLPTIPGTKQERIQLHSRNSSVSRLTYYNCAADVTTLLLFMLSLALFCSFLGIFCWISERSFVLFKLQSRLQTILALLVYYLTFCYCLLLQINNNKDNVTIQKWWQPAGNSITSYLYLKICLNSFCFVILKTHSHTIYIYIHYAQLCRPTCSS